MICVMLYLGDNLAQGFFELHVAAQAPRKRRKVKKPTFPQGILFSVGSLPVEKSAYRNLLYL